MPKRRHFSESDKETALDYYKEHGLKETCQQFDVAKTVLLSWRRRAGVEKSSRKSSHKYHERRAYSPKYKLQVLRDATLLGPEKAAEKHSINSNLVYCWRTKEADLRAKVESNKYNLCDIAKQDGKSDGVRCEYTQEFKTSVLCDFNSLGATKTAEKYGINPCLIYKWKDKETDLQKQCPQASPDAVKTIKICKQTMTDYQREVLDHFVECGLKLTMKKFAIKQRRLLNWRKKFNEHYEGKLFNTKHDGEMMEVVDYANTHGLRKATLKYGVTIKTIWDWKAKVQLSKKGSKFQTKGQKRVPRPRRSVDEDTKGEIIQTYLEEGAFATEKKYNIPRQTVRYWALQRGTVQVRRGLSLAKDALNSAQKNGVQETVAKFSISRASLYNWAKKFGMNMSETKSEGSITLKVSDGTKERNIVFYKRKAKPVTIKFKSKPEKKPKEKKRKKEEPELETIPDWVVEFIGKKVPKVGIDQGQIVLRSNETVFEGEEFTISTPDFMDTSLDPLLEPSDLSSDPEYECDYVELDLFTSLPFFTPSNILLPNT